MNNTETVQVLLGSNNCTCFEIACNGELTVVVTNSNSSLADIICPAFVLEEGTCFNIGECNNFDVHSAYHPFFRICENPLDSSRCSVCFDNVTPDLSGVKLFFYTSIKNDCGSQEHLTTTREYFRSFHINSKFCSTSINFYQLRVQLI